SARAATSVNMCAASLMSARLFVSQPPASSPTQKSPHTARLVRTALSSPAWSRDTPTVQRLFGVVAEQGEDLVRRQPPSPAQEGELDDEPAADDLSAAAGDQLERRRRRAAGGEQVVDQEHAMLRPERVAVDLERVATVLELVARGVGLVRQLARLAHDGHPGAERVRGGGDDEPARLDAEHHVRAAAKVRGEGVDRGAEGARVGEQRRDVLEDDPRL